MGSYFKSFGKECCEFAQNGIGLKNVWKNEYFFRNAEHFLMEPFLGGDDNAYTGIIILHQFNFCPSHAFSRNFRQLHLFLNIFKGEKKETFYADWITTMLNLTTFIGYVQKKALGNTFEKLFRKLCHGEKKGERNAIFRESATPSGSKKRRGDFALLQRPEMKFLVVCLT